MPIQAGYGVYAGGVNKGGIRSSGLFGGGGLGYGARPPMGYGAPPTHYQQNPLMAMQQSMQGQQMYQQQQTMAFAQQRDLQNFLRTPQGQQALAQHQQALAIQQQQSLAIRKQKGQAMYDQAKANRRPGEQTQLVGAPKAAKATGNSIATGIMAALKAPRAAKAPAGGMGMIATGIMAALKAPRTSKGAGKGGSTVGTGRGAKQSNGFAIPGNQIGMYEPGAGSARESLGNQAVRSPGAIANRYTGQDSGRDGNYYEERGDGILDRQLVGRGSGKRG